MQRPVHQNLTGALSYGKVHGNSVPGENPFANVIRWTAVFSFAYTSVSNQ